VGRHQRVSGRALRGGHSVMCGARVWVCEDTYAVSESLVSTDTEAKAEPDTNTAQDVWG